MEIIEKAFSRRMRSPSVSSDEISRKGIKKNLVSDNKYEISTKGTISLIMQLIHTEESTTTPKCQLSHYKTSFMKGKS